MRMIYLEIWHSTKKRVQFRQEIAQDIQEVRMETDSVAMDRVSKELDEKKHCSRRP